MQPWSIWALIAGNIALALTANAVATIWAGQGGRNWALLAVLVVISPVIFITFGVVSARVGLAVGSAMIDSALTISSILLGLILFGGWRDVTVLQYGGMGLAVAGIVLMQFGKAQKVSPLIASTDRENLEQEDRLIDLPVAGRSVRFPEGASRRERGGGAIQPPGNSAAPVRAGALDSTCPRAGRRCRI